MAYVKRNKDVKDKQDLQNLVIGIIFRMQEPYTKEKIVEIVNYHLKGSKFHDDIETIAAKVEENLQLLCRQDKVQGWRGVYYPRDPITKQFPASYYEILRKNKEGILLR